MTDEEIIALAIKKYPIGTEVTSLGGTKNSEVFSHDLYWDSNMLRSNSDCGLYHKKDESWAKITKQVIPTVINNYELY